MPSDINIRGTYVIDGVDLLRLRGVMTRLFSERRLSGDEMRDAAQAIEVIVRKALDLGAFKVEN